jgi:serine/threonine protein kinase
MKYGDGQLMSQSVGTIYSMAPEVLCGKTYTNACDVWSIGVITYMLLGAHFEMPFNGDNDIEIAKAILACQFDFSGPHWATVSEEAKDFIRNCLAKYPHHRHTVKSALQSDWLTGAKPQPISEDVKEKLLVSLQEYILFPKLKREALMMIAFSLQPSDPRVKPLRQVFSVFESHSCDGRINFMQFKESFLDLDCHAPEEDLHAIFLGIDMDKSQKLDYLELYSGLIHGFGFLNDLTLAKVFDDLDSHGRGYISAEDLKVALGTDYDDNIWKSFQTTSKKGRIHFHEFNAYMRKPNALSVHEYLLNVNVDRASFCNEDHERSSRCRTKSFVDVATTEAVSKPHPDSAFGHSKTTSRALSNESTDSQAFRASHAKTVSHGSSMLSTSFSNNPPNSFPNSASNSFSNNASNSFSNKADGIKFETLNYSMEGSFNETNETPSHSMEGTFNDINEILSYSLDGANHSMVGWVTVNSTEDAAKGSHVPVGAPPPAGGRTATVPQSQVSACCGESKCTGSLRRWFCR